MTIIASRNVCFLCDIANYNFSWMNPNPGVFCYVFQTPYIGGMGDKVQIYTN